MQWRDSDVASGRERGGEGNDTPQKWREQQNARDSSAPPVEVKRIGTRAVVQSVTPVVTLVLVVHDVRRGQAGGVDSTPVVG